MSVPTVADVRLALDRMASPLPIIAALVAAYLPGFTGLPLDGAVLVARQIVSALLWTAPIQHSGDDAPTISREWAEFSISPLAGFDPKP